VRARRRHSRTPVWSQCFVEEAKPPTRGADRARVVDVAQEFLGEVGVGDVTVAVTVTQHHEQPVVLLVAEPFVTDEEPAADPIQRIVASAPVTERLLLHATASVVDRPCSPTGSRGSDQRRSSRRVGPVRPVAYPRNGSMTATSIA
jgi:hypothetical protein